MKIEFDDVCFSEVLEELADAVVRLKMRRHMNDPCDYSHPEDKEYYEEVKEAAKIIYKHYSPPKDQ